MLSCDNCILFKNVYSLAKNLVSTITVYFSKTLQNCHQIPHHPVELCSRDRNLWDRNLFKTSRPKPKLHKIILSPKPTLDHFSVLPTVFKRIASHLPNWNVSDIPAFSVQTCFIFSLPADTTERKHVELKTLLRHIIRAQA